MKYNIGMKYKANTITVAVILICGMLNIAFAQNPQIQDIKVLNSGVFENQGKSSTCWAFSGMSFFQAELIRMGKIDDLNLSEMFVVRQMYPLKAENYVRMHGKANFGEGGVFSDNLICLRNFGLMPQSVYSGNSHDGAYDHQKLLTKLEPIVGQLGSSSSTIRPDWKNGVDSILNEFFNTIPKSFSYKGKNHTPLSFTRELGLNADDYILITSFTHHPYYQPFILEVPDNWNWEKVYNIPLSELTEVAKHAVEQGYPVAWAADISDKGFSSDKAIAVCDEGTPVSAEERQKAFDAFETQDDHGMLIVGLAEDDKGIKYFKVKNSWGTKSPAGQYLYTSENYFGYKTTCIMLNRHALPKKIARKLGV